MSNLNSCARCGAELRPQNSGGLCTRCLLEGGLEVSLADPNSPQPGKAQALGTGVEEPTARNFGDYELLEEIARGGMGVVYRARQPRLGRILALKMILAGPFASKQVIQRFRGEVTAAALLQHPNIVAIHDVGLHDGQHYFTMDYVEGQNLAQLVGNRPLSPAKAARYVRLIAEAIHYAHQQGILHRDLKPSNVLVDASDQPRVTDFGLAKRLDGDASLTLTGQMLGSPNFMPPEQASSQRGKVGRTGDVYGLGAILYYLLTARPPFQAESFESILTQLLNTEPVSPRMLNSSVPRDLETLCVKCLQKEPSRRYQSAQEVADELDRFLRDEPIQARPVTRAERTWRWCRRRPALAGLVAALVLVFLLGFAGTLWQWRHAVQSATAAIEQRHLADANRETAEQNLYSADMHEAVAALGDGDLGRAKELIERHRPRSGQTDLRGFEWRLLWQRCRSDELYALRGYTNALHTLRFSPDGDTLATRTRNGQVKVWDLIIQRERFTITNVTTLGEFTPDGQKFVCGLGDGSVELCDARTGRTFPLLENAGSLVAVLNDGKTVATTAKKFVVKLWDIASRRETFVLPGRGGLDLWGPQFGAGVVITPDGRKLALRNKSARGITLWNLPGKEILNGSLDPRDQGEDPFTFLQLSPDGKVLATGGFSGLVSFWDMATGDELLPHLQAHSESVVAAAFSPDGRVLATAGLDQTIKVWDIATRHELNTLKGHENGVFAVTFSADGKRLASGGQDNTVRLWNVGQKRTKQVLSGVAEKEPVIWSPDCSLLAVACTNQTVTIWEAATLESRSVLPGACRALAFGHDGRTILAKFGDGSVKYCEVATGKVIQESPKLPAAAWECVAISPDQQYGAINDFTPIIKLWGIAAGTNYSLTGHRGEARVVSFSPDGQTFINGGKDGMIDIWDVRRRQYLASIAAHDEQVFGIAISPVGAVLASSSTDNTIKLWNLNTRSCLAILNGHKRPVWALAFSPDGRTLASGSGDRTIRLWNVSLRREVAVLRGFARGKSTFFETLRTLTFSPDGNALAAVNHGGDLILFRAASPEEVAARVEEQPMLRQPTP